VEDFPACTGRDGTLSVVLAGIATLALACVTTTIEPGPLNADLARSAEIIVSGKGFYLPAGSTMSWRAEIIWHEGDENVASGNLSEADVQAAIERELTQKGYRFVRPEAGSDYKIVVAVLMGASERAAELQQIANIDPVLVAASKDLDRGTLIVAINHSQSPKILWRGAVQAFLAEGLTGEESGLRLDAAIRRLFRGLPQSPQEEAQP